MRNLKRVLSLALAAVMLMGMMIVGASAADVGSFNDADQIVNVEAAQLTTGLEIFKGDGKGNFMPNKAVTRAEMATIIVKLLYGADYNADGLKGIQRFDDTASFEGGWAEGYINVCAQLGIVSGYAGTNHFGPGDTVTTAQAALMLMKALGWFDGNNPRNEYGDNWQLAAMSKADQLGLRGNVAMQANQALTRDNVSLLVYNTLFAQLVSYQDSLKDYAKANNHNVTVNSGTADASNTLARTVYNLFEVEGVVTANGMTDAKLYSDNETPGDTRMVFPVATDILDTGRSSYTTYDFAYDTGLDMIGHNAAVYYQLVRGVPVVKAIVDRAVLVETIPYDANSTRLASAANALGFKRNTILNFKVEDYMVNYDMSSKASAVNALNGGGKLSANMFNGTVGKSLVVISNSVDCSVDYVFVLDQEIDQVDTINRQGVIALEDNGGNANTKRVAPVAGYVPAEDDYVIVTNIGNQDKRLVIEQPEMVAAYVTQYEGRVGSLTGITAGGVNYLQSPVFANKGEIDRITPYQEFNEFADMNLLLDRDGKLIASVGKEAAPPKYCYVAWYGSVHIDPISSGSSVEGFTTEGLAAYVYFSDNTKGVYRVDAGSNGVLKKTDTNGNGTGTVNGGVAYWNADSTRLDAAIAVLNEDFYHTDTYAVDANHGTTTHTACTGGLGIWAYTIVGGNSIKLISLIDTAAKSVDETANKTTTKFLNNTVDSVGSVDSGTDRAVRFVRGHSGVLSYAWSTDKVVASNIQKTGGTTTADTLWQDKNTVYFYVTGEVDESIDATVTAKTGVTAMDSFDVTAVPGDFTAKADARTKTGETWAEQVFAYEPTTGNNTVRAVLVRNAGVEETGPIYYYTKGTDTFPTYTLKEIEKDKKYEISYRMYDLDGVEEWKTFEYDGSKSAATAKAKDKETGYYEVLASDIREYVVLKAPTGTEWTYNSGSQYSTKNVANANRMYVVNAALQYDEKTENLIDNVTDVGFIFNLDRNTTVVDTCGSGLESLSDIINAFEKEDTVNCRLTISYIYNTKNWTAGTVFITEYAPSGTDAPGGGTTVGSDLDVSFDRDGNALITSTNPLTAKQVGDAIRQARSDDDITKVTYSTSTKRAVITYADGTETDIGVTIGYVASEEAVAGAGKIVEIQNKIGDTSTTGAEVKIEGNTITTIPGDAANTTAYLTPGGDGTSNATKDLVAFLKKLYEDGATTIRFNSKDYVWFDTIRYQSKWAETGTSASDITKINDTNVDTEDGKTLTKAIETALTAKVSAANNGDTISVTISADGAEMVIGIKIAK